MGRKFFEELTIESEITPLHEKISRETVPVFIWGTGALAIDVYQYCKNFGIQVAGCFVDVPTSAVQFEGMPIWTLEDLTRQYPQFGVLIGHANYAAGIERLKQIENVTQAYCITSCCYGIWNVVTADFLNENAPALDAFYDDLRDEQSKGCLKSYFESRMNDLAEYMFPFYKPGTTYYENDVIELTRNEILMDVGACKGSAIWPFIDTVGGAYSKIIALEPECENYQILKESIRARGLLDVVICNVCAYNKNGEVKFSGGDELGGISDGANDYQLCPARTIDSLCRELDLPAAVSLIKINFPFSVPEILQGAAELLKEERPKLIIRAGFDENVLVETYRTIKSINPAYQFYLRYTIGIPQGLTIFAV